MNSITCSSAGSRGFPSRTPARWGTGSLRVCRRFKDSSPRIRCSSARGKELSMDSWRAVFRSDRRGAHDLPGCREAVRRGRGERSRSPGRVGGVHLAVGSGDAVQNRSRCALAVAAAPAGVGVLPMNAAAALLAAGVLISLVSLARRVIATIRTREAVRRPACEPPRPSDRCPVVPLAAVSCRLSRRRSTTCETPRSTRFEAVVLARRSAELARVRREQLGRTAGRQI